MKTQKQYVGVAKKLKAAIEAVVGEEVNLEVPELASYGDYSTNIAMQSGGNPREKAADLLEKLQKDKKVMVIVDKVEVAGPGFINFWLNHEALGSNLGNINSNFGKSDVVKGKKAIVEYSSPNIAKPFTVGHLRSTVIGDAVANLLEATGWTVLRDNHLGDWGTQFGKQIYAIKTWGDEKEIDNSKNPVKELVALYVKFHDEAEKDESLNDKAREWFKKLEDGDSEARRLWQKCVDWSWQEFNKIYKRLGFDGFYKDFDGGRGLGEAFFEDKMQPVIDLLQEKGLLKEGKEGAKLFFFAKDKYPPAMILKKDGATLYHTRDLATDKYRLDNYHPDLIINEVGAEQKLYFQQLYEMESILGWYESEQRVHVYHGLIRFKDGKMSTRKGNTIWLEEILDKSVKMAEELGSENVELAQSVGVGAIKYNDLKRDPKTDIVFDWDEILNMQGNSGPYLQYTYARIQSVLAKAKAKGKADLAKANEQEMALLRTFVHFPEVVAEAATMYAPNLVCNYLFDLAQKFNAFYAEYKILDGENEDLKLAITAATGQILANGLMLLGISAPDKM